MTAGVDADSSHAAAALTAPAIPLRAWLFVCVLVVFSTVAAVDRTLIAMLVDPIRKDLHINDTQIALLMGLAYASAYSLGGLPMGYLADKAPRKWLVYFAVSFWGLAEAACGMGTGFLALFLARMGVGLGESPLHPSAHSMIADTFPKRRLATAMSLYSTGNLIGTGAALIIGGWIVNALLHYDHITVPILGDLKPWQFAFVITGLPGLLLAMLILPFKEPARLSHAEGGTGTWLDLWRFVKRNWAVVLCLGLTFGGMNIFNGALIKWQPTYMSRFFHLNPAEYGMSLGLIYVVAGVGGLLFSGWLVDRLYAAGHRDAHMRYFMWVIILTSPIVLYGLLSNNLTIYLVTITLAKFATVNSLGIAASLVQLITPPSLRGRMSAIFFLMIMAFMGSTFGPLVPALISDYVFHDEVHLGRSMGATLCIFAPIAVAAILLGRRPLQRALDDARAWADAK